MSISSISGVGGFSNVLPSVKKNVLQDIVSIINKNTSDRERESVFGSTSKITVNDFINIIKSVPHSKLSPIVAAINNSDSVRKNAIFGSRDIQVEQLINAINKSSKVQFTNALSIKNLGYDSRMSAPVVVDTKKMLEDMKVLKQDNASLKEKLDLEGKDAQLKSEKAESEKLKLEKEKDLALKLLQEKEAKLKEKVIDISGIEYHFFSVAAKKNFENGKDSFCDMHGKQMPKFTYRDVNQNYAKVFVSQEKFDEKIKDLLDEAQRNKPKDKVYFDCVIMEKGRVEYKTKSVDDVRVDIWPSNTLFGLFKGVKKDYISISTSIIKL
jgi:hypothetical protein